MLNLNPNEKIVKNLQKIVKFEEVQIVKNWLNDELNLLREEADNQSNYQAMLVAMGHRQALKEIINILSKNFFEN
ncbi:hypothetical protein AAEX28_12940 [Lentisphaerota bacterium WC36G]|nr:hypothetical protein LJT99_15760 [Lentisphaerae bacterium WC36]